MPRRGNIAKRDVLADPIYNSKMVTRLVNSVMLDGKKGVAQNIDNEVYSFFQENFCNYSLFYFENALPLRPLLATCSSGWWSSSPTAC